MSERLNIALFASHLEDDYANSVCVGAIMAAKEIDANLYIFPGRYLDPDYNDKERTIHEYQYNTLFSYVNSENMDALISMTGAICGTIEEKKKIEFLNQFKGVPIINIGVDIPGYDGIKFDNGTGLKEGIRHLVKNHHKTKIAFVSGPKTNEDAMECLLVYKDTLEELGLPYNEEYVVYGNFSEYSTEIVKELLSREIEIEAVVFANDQMAIGGYKVFRHYNLNVGSDILVMGFDDAPCALNLEPNLTTVRADASKLGYQAVLESANLIQKGSIEKDYINSSLVIRQSCGCQGTEIEQLLEELGFEDFKESSLEEAADCINKYLFGSYDNSKSIEGCENAVRDFVIYLLTECRKGGLSDQAQKFAVRRFEEIIRCDIFSYISNERFFNGLDILYYRIYTYFDNPEKCLVLSQLFVRFYKYMTSASMIAIREHESDVENLNHLINRITRDMLLFEHNDDNVYATVLDKLVRLNMNSSYLYLFDRPVEHYEREKWIPPKEILLKTFHNNNKVVSVPVNEQRMLTKDIFSHKYIPKDRRCTMVLTPLFSNLEHYGLLLCELEHDYFHYLSSISFQLFAALKLIRVLGEKEEAQRKLKESLEQIKENNLMLDEISKSDELTGIYNRRGFLGTVKNIIKHPRNHGKKAVAVYADMDNLKIINDQFGHEDGDFSLCMIARILKESFRSSDIVGRMGGDEFAAFALIDQENLSEIIKDRIRIISAERNNESDKPYFVNMSIGVYEFYCGKDIDVEDVLNEADKDLYIEKKNKKKVVLKNQ